MKEKKTVKQRMAEMSEIDSKVAEVSVAVIRYNRIVDGLRNEIMVAQKKMEGCVSSFVGQREIEARVALLKRALNSALKFLEQGSLQLHHIDREASKNKNNSER